MSSTQIRVLLTAKVRLEEVQAKLHQGSVSDTVSSLIDYYHRNERQKELDKQQAEKDKKVQKETLLYVGQELKQKYMAFSNNVLQVKNESAALEFLYEHYLTSPNIQRSTLEWFLQRGRM